jgi:hypothetical protein
MKTNILKRSLVALLFCTSVMVFSQGPTEDSDNGGINDDGTLDSTGDGMPIDGGLTLLLAAGALYGAKKVNDKRNK